jgi:hypothetical protein
MKYDLSNGTFTVPRMTASSFSGNLEGRVTTTQIDLQDPKNKNSNITITNSNGRIVLGSHEPVKEDGMPQSTAAKISSEPAIAAAGPANQGGSVSCARGYSCTASRGRLTLVSSAAAGAGTIASVKTTLPTGAICIATQNGRVSFLGIGSGKESANGFDITASAAPRGTLTIDYDCR